MWGFEHLRLPGGWMERSHATLSHSILWLRAVSGERIHLWAISKAANTLGNWENECLAPEGGSGWLSRASTATSESLVWTTIPSQLDHCNGLQTGFLFYTVPSVTFLKLSSYVAMMYNYFKINFLSHKFQMCNVIVWHLYTLQSDHHHKFSYHPSPYRLTPSPFPPVPFPLVTSNLFSVSVH